MSRLCGDDTHAAVAQPKWASGHGPQSVVNGVGGLRAWPTDKCSNKDAGENERKTPTPLSMSTGKERERRKRKRTLKTSKRGLKGVPLQTAQQFFLEMLQEIVKRLRQKRIRF